MALQRPTSLMTRTAGGLRRLVSLTAMTGISIAGFLVALEIFMSTLTRTWYVSIAVTAVAVVVVAIRKEGHVVMSSIRHGGGSIVSVSIRERKVAELRGRDLEEGAKRASFNCTSSLSGDVAVKVRK